VFYNDLLARIRTVEDLDIYHQVDRYLGHIFNNAYNFLSKNNIKVKNNIYVINNDSFKKFTNWFVSRYNNRIEYKTILELIRQEDNFNGYSVLETPSINFVVGKNETPNLDKTAEIEVETFDSFISNVKEEKRTIKREEKSAGFVSYVLLAVVSFVVSFALLFLFVK